MSSFTSGCCFWYSFAASTRVASTQTVIAPSFCDTWAKPSLVVVLAVPPPQAVRASAAAAAQPASNAVRLLLDTLSRPDEGLLTVMCDSSGARIGATPGPNRSGVVDRGRQFRLPSRMKLA